MSDRLSVVCLMDDCRFLLGGVPPSNVMCPAFLFLTSEVS